LSRANDESIYQENSGLSKTFFIEKIPTGHNQNDLQIIEAEL